MQHKLFQKQSDFAFEVTQNNVKKPIKLKPNSISLNKALRRKKNEKQNCWKYKKQILQ